MDGRLIDAHVELLRTPSDDDWMRCKLLAIGTEGKTRVVTPPDYEWRVRMLRARHSPIRTLMFTIRMEVPYWVSVHYVRHKVGVEHYVRSQRNDRQHDYDRNSAPQDMPVVHVMDVNADALITMMQKRLCGKAAVETRDVVSQIREAVDMACPEFQRADMLPPCLCGGCREFVPCGRFEEADHARD